MCIFVVHFHDNLSALAAGSAARAIATPSSIPARPSIATAGIARCIPSSASPGTVSSSPSLGAMPPSSTPGQEVHKTRVSNGDTFIEISLFSIRPKAFARNDHISRMIGIGLEPGFDKACILALAGGSSMIARQAIGPRAITIGSVSAWGAVIARASRYIDAR